MLGKTVAATALHSAMNERITERDARIEELEKQLTDRDEQMLGQRPNIQSIYRHKYRH